jgi:hypothetical protein
VEFATAKPLPSGRSLSALKSPRCAVRRIGGAAHRPERAPLHVPAAAAALAEGVDQAAVEAAGWLERAGVRVLDRVAEHRDLVDAAVDDAGLQPHDVGHFLSVQQRRLLDRGRRIRRVVLLPDRGACLGGVVVDPVDAGGRGAVRVGVRAGGERGAARIDVEGVGLAVEAAFLRRIQDRTLHRIGGQLQAAAHLGGVGGVAHFDRVLALREARQQGERCIAGRCLLELVGHVLVVEHHLHARNGAAVGGGQLDQRVVAAGHLLGRGEALHRHCRLVAGGGAAGAIAAVPAISAGPTGPAATTTAAAAAAGQRQRPEQQPRRAQRLLPEPCLCLSHLLVSGVVVQKNRSHLIASHFAARPSLSISCLSLA